LVPTKHLLITDNSFPCHKYSKYLRQKKPHLLIKKDEVLYPCDKFILAEL